MTPDQVVRQAIQSRAVRLHVVREAVREGRAYLNTYVGVRKITFYCDDTGHAFTNNTGRAEDAQTFLVALESIHINPRAEEKS